MEWFILIFLVLLILVPIVLLCGFAGCGYSGVATGEGPSVAAPSDLSAKATGVDEIVLTWHDNTGGPTNFAIERGLGGSSGLHEIGQTGATTFPDHKQLGLVEGNTYFYQVRVKIPSNLFGGVPCDKVGVTTFPATPTNLVATTLDAGPVKLSWDNASATATKFIVEHRPSPTSAWDPKPVYAGTETFLPNSTSPAPAITPGGNDEFRVTAVVVNGYDDNVPKEVKSVRSAPVSVVSQISLPPPPFKIAYDEGSLTSDAAFGLNETFVQRIPSANLHNSGTKVRITLAQTTANLVIDKVTISQGKSGGKLYDSVNDLTEVKSGGKSGVSLVAGPPPKTLDDTNYTLDQTKDLLIAFHIVGPSPCRKKAVTGAKMFHKANTSEADKPAAFNRAVGYATEIGGPTPPGTGEVYLVRAIEVA